MKKHKKTKGRKVANKTIKANLQPKGSKSHMKLIPRSFGYLVESASSESVRYALTGVLVEFDKKTTKGIASNGTQLILAEVPSVSPSKFPNVGLNGIDFKRVILESGALAKATSQVPKKPSLGIFNNIAINKEDEKSKKITLVTADAGSKTIEESEEIEGNFPDWKAVIPKDDKKDIFICVDARKLANLLETIMRIAELGKYSNHAVKIHIRGKDSAMKVTTFNKETNINVTGVLMPLAIDM